jgi:hypothetical protein
MFDIRAVIFCSLSILGRASWRLHEVLDLLVGLVRQYRRLWIAWFPHAHTAGYGWPGLHPAGECMQYAALGAYRLGRYINWCLSGYGRSLATHSPEGAGLPRSSQCNVYRICKLGSSSNKYFCSVLIIGQVQITDGL